MKDSEQIKQAPDPTGRTHFQQIFKNFTDATVALLESPDTPAELRTAIVEAITEAGNQIAGGLSDVGIVRAMLHEIFSNKTEGEAS